METKEMKELSIKKDDKRSDGNIKTGKSLTSLMKNKSHPSV